MEFGCPSRDSPKGHRIVPLLSLQNPGGRNLSQVAFPCRMRNTTRLRALQVCVLLACVLETRATPVLISQVLKGRVFGSPNSNELSKRIVVGGDGSLYIAGTTTPGKADEFPWGDAEAGELTGKEDIFLAKFSASGQLIWVKRTGSSQTDVVNDLKIANNGLYLCGSTEGKLGIPSQGSSDAFLLKFSLDGFKVWKHPFQFGSRGYDSCQSLEIDQSSRRLFVTGRTNGRMFGTVTPREGTFHCFVASFEELENDPLGLQLIKGRQQGSYGSCSGDGVAVAKNRLYLMTTNWDEQWGEMWATTHLNVLDRDALALHKLHALNSTHGGRFRGMRMTAINDTGDVYIAGISSRSRTPGLYHTLKFSSSADSGKGGVVWMTRVGAVVPKAWMVHQTPAIVADLSNNMVYVAGIEDGYFTSGGRENSGIVAVPFLKLNMTDGRINQCWHRTTTVPLGREELTDIALDPGKAVVYTGVWDGGPDFHANALIGSFGSPGHSSRVSGSRPVSDSAFIQAAPEESNERSKMSKGQVIRYSLLGVGGVGIVLTVLVVYSMRSSARNVELDDDDLPAAHSEMEEIRKKVAESHRNTGFSQAEALDVVVGGSGDPH